MNWRNSNFQIVAFIVGKCHTADEAYRKLRLQILDRRKALEASNIALKKAELARLKALDVLNGQDTSAQDRLAAEITLSEIANEAQDLEPLIEGAKQELAFMGRLAELVQPYRKYKDLPDAEAFQATQREEWCLELIHRAQNFLYCAGTIPTDHFDTMRAHPDFGAIIAPAVDVMQKALRDRDLDKLKSFTVLPRFKAVLMDEKLLGPTPDLAALPASSIKYLGR